MGAQQHARPEELPARFRLAFHDGKAFLRQGGREWPIAEVRREEMLWAPDGVRFAYVKQQASSALCRIVIRNVRGDSVNEFEVYRPGRPSDLEWIDNITLGYLAPNDESGDAYVMHSATTGEILKVFRGSRFIWSPGRRQLAYVANQRREPLVKVDQRTVWPREASVALHTKRHRDYYTQRIISDLSWSPDGGGLAFIARRGSSVELVVLLVVDNREGDLTWQLPAGAATPGNRVFWAENKVLIGHSLFEPRFSASWNRVQ